MESVYQLKIHLRVTGVTYKFTIEPNSFSRTTDKAVNMRRNQQ